MLGKRCFIREVLLALLFALIQVSFVGAQTSTFTYQGRFTDGGTPANGTYDMQFKLFDGAGNQIGSTITNSAVTVTSGVFTVQLDYGAAAFPGADRLLEIAVRPAGSGDPYTVLSPRQALTSTPYAIRAGATTTADNATQLGGVVANQYVQTNDARLSDARPPTANSSAYIQNTNSQQPANFNISGDGTAAGTLSAQVVDATVQYNVKGIRALSADFKHNTFLGFSTGTANTGEFNTFAGDGAGASNTSGEDNSFYGAFAGNESTSSGSNSFFGSQTGRRSVGDNNSFFGVSTGVLNKGDSNSFFGRGAGFFNTANENAFFGYRSGELNTTGTRNSYFGTNTGDANETTSDNSLFGYQAGKASHGSSNSFFGSLSGQQNTTGFANSFLGFETGNGNTGGFNNAFFGRGAGQANVGGNSNTALGAFAEFDSPNLSNATAIGAGAHVSHSNTVVLGRNSDTVEVPGTLAVLTLGGAGSNSLCRNVLNQISSCSSSLRYKKDLHPFTRGLALLNQLKPITFKWKADGSDDLGFGAEDIAAVEPLLVTRNGKGEVEGVKYDRISAVLVNALKEQQEQIKKQREQIESLKRLAKRRLSKARP